VKEVKRPSVMMVPFAYPDYPPEDINRQIDLSEQALAEAGLTVIRAPAVITEDDVPGALQALHRSEYDLIVALVVSWVAAPLFVAALRPFFSRPILL